MVPPSIEVEIICRKLGFITLCASDVGDNWGDILGIVYARAGVKGY